MTAWAAGVVVLVMSAGSGNALAEPAEPDLGARLDAVLAPLFAADQPGAAVLVRKGDQVLLRKGYGRANLEAALPMQPELVFRIGSVTKQFTAVAIMMLVDAGKLSLRDDPHKWVPEYPAHGAPITIEQLLTHTSGVPSYTEQPGYLQQMNEDLTHQQVLATFKDLPLEFPPGEKWKYSNSNYYLLGLIIEKVSRQSYAQFMADKIFKPLGMTHTRRGDNDSVQSGGVRGYDPQPTGARPAADLSMTSPFAAGGLISSVDDLALWDRAIAAGRLLTRASWRRVFTPVKLNDGSTKLYGYGWQVITYEGHRVQSHGGAIPGFSSEILRMPDDHLLVAVLCNALPAPTSLDPLALKLAALVIGKPIDGAPIATVDPQLLERYAGVYLVGKHTTLVRRADDHLRIEVDGRQFINALPTSDTTFVVKGQPGRFSFLRDPKTGEVTGIDVVNPDGRPSHGERTDQPLPPEKAAIALAPAVLERYVGQYELRPGFNVAITREGARLFTRAGNQPRFELLASSPTEFFMKELPVRVTFYSDGDAPADRLVVHQNGREVPGKRVP